MTATQQASQIAVVPALTVDDLDKAIAFYEALGFSVDDRWENQGTLLGVMMRAGAAQIGLNQDDWKKGRDRKKGVGVRVSFATTVENVGAIATRVKAAGFALASEPTASDWAASAFDTTDPSGILVTVYAEK